MRLNLGAGSRPAAGWVNVDAVPQDGIDQVADLNVLPWPWKDGEAEEIAAFDVFEHVDNPVAFMTECHRILAPGGKLSIHTTWIGNPDSFTDPTHRRFCTEQTFDYWIEGTAMHRTYGRAYGNVTFLKVRVGVGPDRYLDVRLRKPVTPA